MGYRGVEGAESIGFSLDVLESPEPDIVCPSVPYHGINNFWSASCRIKQQMPEHKTTCYPHCKKQPYKVESVGGHNKELVHHRSKTAEELRAAIVALAQAGHDVLDIMKTLELKCSATVYKHLRIAGIKPLQKTRESKKAEVMKLLAKDDTLTPQQIVNIVGKIEVRSAQLYIAEYFRNINNPTAKQRAFEELKKNPNLTPTQLSNIVGCKRRTAKDYKTQFKYAV